MLGMVPSMFRCLNLSQPSNKENTGYKRNCEEFTGYALHFQIPTNPDHRPRHANMIHATKHYRCNRCYK